MLSANNGVWNVAAAGAKRIGDDAPADMAVDIRELSAAYLGGTRWSSLAAAGRVDVRNPAAVVLADALFAVPEAPYSCSGF
jgi:predicted acetyltransferase